MIAILDDNNVCYIVSTDETMKGIFVDSYDYLGQTYKDGVWVDTRKPEKPEPTEQDILNAEMLLNQTNIINTQKEQDEVLAQLLLNQVGGVNNV